MDVKERYWRTGAPVIESALDSLESVEWTYLMIVDEDLAEEIDRITISTICVLLVHKIRPWSFRIPAGDVAVFYRQLNLILVQPIEEFLSTQNFRDLHHLIDVVVASEEEWLLAENDCC